MFNFQKSISNLVNIDGEINIIIEKCKPKTKIEYDKIRVASILNEIRKSILDLFFFYVHHDTIFKQTKKYYPQRLNMVLSTAMGIKKKNVTGILFWLLSLQRSDTTTALQQQKKLSKICYFW